jgi:hypothetical protein
MFMFDWSALMPPSPPIRPTWTAWVQFRNFVSNRHLAPKFQHSLSAVTLSIYLCGMDAAESKELVEG